MDCPHCAAENLAGARICVSCGRSMRTQPAFRAAATVTNAQLAPPAEAPLIEPSRRRIATEVTTLNAPAPAHEPAHQPAPPPAPAAPEAPAATPPAEGAPVGALCRVCLEEFSRPRSATGPAICPTCREFAPEGGADAGRNKVKFHPATQEQPDVDPRAG